MKNRNIVILVLFYVLILILIGVFQPREIDWRPTFASGDRIPYGTYILRQRLADIFPSSAIQTSSESIYKTLHKKQFTNTNYILIEPELSISPTDKRELLKFVAEGNNVFIASMRSPDDLLDTLGFYTKYTLPSFIERTIKTDTIRSLAVSLISPSFAQDSTFEFEANNIPQYFSNDDRIVDTDDIDSTSTNYDSLIIPLAKQVQVISTMSHTRPIYVRVSVGKGYIYMHTFPFAFTNYYLLKDSTRRYAENCLSYLPNGNILWDEHYKIEPSRQHVSTLGFILTNNSLRWAYYTGILFILLFVAFNIKRRQRIIPVVAPFRNTTLEFTETVGRLYFNRGDHKNIVEKKIRFFMEYVRTRYYIDTQTLDADFVEKLTAKSGIEKERIQYMTQLMKSMLTKQNIADTELIQLNDQIEYFKKHSS